MTKFNGPGLYRIVDYQAPNQAVNSWGGTLNAEDVKLYPKSDNNPNSTFEFALVSGPGEEAEYLIINCKSGYYLTGNPNNSVIRSEQSSPTNPRSRWTLSYSQSQGQYDTYFINCADSSCGQMNVSGGSQQTGTQILSYKTENGENCKFYLDPK